MVEQSETQEKNANAPAAVGASTATPAAKTAVKTTVKTRRKKAVVKKTTIKITKFDKALAQQIILGETSLKKIQEKMRVDEKEFFERVKKLGDAGYIVTNELGETRFGIKGFEAFANQFKKLASAPTPKSRAQLEETLSTAQAPPAPQAQAPPAPQAQTPQTPAQQTQQTQSHFTQPTVQPALDPKQTFLAEATAKEKNEDNVDLSELLKKGAPKPSDSIFVKRQNEKSSKAFARAAFARAFETIKTQDPAKVSTVEELIEAIKKSKPSGEALMVDGGEACELCKTNFKLAVAGGNPKYGHCFCGAAYHKDCYESLADNGGKCVRCGKKLKLELSKQSEEAVKEIKELF